MKRLAAVIELLAGLIRPAGNRVHDGTAEALREWGRRVAASSRWERLGGAVAVVIGLVIWWRMMLVWTWLTAALIAAWVVKAWRAADREEAEEEQRAARTAELTRTADELFLRLLVQLIGDGSGIHLETLLPQLQEADAWQPWTRADLRALLARLDVRVRESLRVGSRTGVPGVHRNDAAAALRAYLAAHSPSDGQEV